MRATPLGVLRSVSDVLEVAAMQACITHNTPEGVFSAQAVALMSHYALYEAESLKNISEYCLSNLPSEGARRFGEVLRTRWHGGQVGLSGSVISLETVHAVADLVANELSLMAILKKTIEWGGDTDSVAAIAWGIASSRYQDERLPAFMWQGLEQGNPATGTFYLAGLGKKLMEKYNA